MNKEEKSLLMELEELKIITNFYSEMLNVDEELTLDDKYTTLTGRMKVLKEI